ALRSSHGQDAQESYEGSDDGSDDDVTDQYALANESSIILQVITPHSAVQDGYCQAASSSPAVIKNILTEDWEAFEATPRTVMLHVYDLEAFSDTNNVLAFMVDEVTLGGAFHTGVEVFGNEWSYGSRGVKCEAPRTAEGHVYRCSIPLGSTSLPVAEVAHVLLELCQTWRGADYDLLTQNCCSFAFLFSERLGVGSAYPPWVDRFARLLGNGRAAGVGVLGVTQQVGELVKAGVGSVM
ncbi:unnamed protein product, partial [Polarella glacialis]